MQTHFEIHCDSENGYGNGNGRSWNKQEFQLPTYGRVASSSAQNENGMVPVEWGHGMTLEWEQKYREKVDYGLLACAGLPVGWLASCWWVYIYTYIYIGYWVTSASASASASRDN